MTPRSLRLLAAGISECAGVEIPHVAVGGEAECDRAAVAGRGAADHELHLAPVLEPSTLPPEVKMTVNELRQLLGSRACMARCRHGLYTRCRLPRVVHPLPASLLKS